MLPSDHTYIVDFGDNNLLTTIGSIVYIYPFVYSSDTVCCLLVPTIEIVYTGLIDASCSNGHIGIIFYTGRVLYSTTPMVLSGV